MGWKSKTLVTGLLCVAALSFGLSARAQVRAGDEKGETRAQKALKNRPTAPGPSVLDKTVSLDALLARKGETDWSSAKGAVVDGHVIQVEKEEDGDLHVVLATNPGETDTRKWVIVEVTPAWRARGRGMSEQAIRGLYARHVRVTGWLYYEPDAGQPDPRGTRWEIHPVTSIVAIR